MTSLQPEIIDDRSLCPASTGLVSPPSVSVGVRGNVAIPMLPEPAIDLREANPGQTADAGAETVWRRYYRSGAGDASEEELVTRYLPLVKTVVGRLAMSLPPHVDHDELYSAGLIGLLNALRQFNPKIGTSFEPYARVRIRGAVLDELRRIC